MKHLAQWIGRMLERLFPPTIQPYVDHAETLAADEEHTEVWEPFGYSPRSATTGTSPLPESPVKPKRNPEFDNLPTVQVLSARMTDDEVDFISDLRYLNDLKIEIFAHSSVFGPEGLVELPEWPTPTFFEDIA